MTNEKQMIYLEEALKATHNEIYWTESQQAAVRSFLVNQPKVDAVEVVRCEDCEFAKYFEESGTWKCRSQNGLYRTVEPTEYCSWGEKKNEVC